MSGPKDHEITLPGDPPDAGGGRRLWSLALAALGFALAILGTLPESGWSWTEWRPSRATIATTERYAMLTLAGGAMFAMAFTILVLWIGRRGMPKGAKKKNEADPTARDKLLLMALVTTSLGIGIALLLLNPWNPNIDLGPWSISEQAERPEGEMDDAGTGFTSDIEASIPDWIRPILHGVFLLGLVATVATSILLAIERVRQKMAQRAAQAERERVACEIAAAAAETIDDLTRPGGDAREAIIRCYARFERSLALAETKRAPWQTPMEFMRTALGALPLAPADVASLTRLFEIARFSRHPLGEDERDRAWDALVSIRKSLAERTEHAPRR